MNNAFSRVALMYGDEAVKKLSEKTVAICGLGGVGSYTAEALARTGVGKFIIIDNDSVDVTNLNRQLIALHSTLGKYKTDIVKQRILDINPNADIKSHTVFLTDNIDEKFFAEADYIADAIDTVTAKLSLIQFADKNNIPIISAMGCGNHTDITKLQIRDIYKTSECPLCKVMRRELKSRNIKKLKTVFSTEKQYSEVKRTPDGKKCIPSTVFVPAAAGLLMAQEIIKDLLEIR